MRFYFKNIWFKIKDANLTKPSRKKKRFNFKSDFGGNDFGISFDRNNNKHHTII